MRGILSLVLIIICNVSFCITPFKKAMHKGYDPSVHFFSKFFGEMYKKRNYELVKDKRLRIPKIIHQIWLGSPVPEKYKYFMNSWKVKNPDWKYVLWTDKELHAFKMINKPLFDKSTLWGTKADLLRYEILERFGGVYVDVDFECVRSMDELVYSHSFFAGIADFDYVNNAIIGAAPHHPLIKRVVRHLQTKTQTDIQNHEWQITGPFFLNYVCYNYFKTHDDGMIYPMKFFYPLAQNNRVNFWGKKLSRANIKKMFIPETFAVHYWAESWMSWKGENEL